MGNDAKSQAGDNRLSRDNAALLLVDHQTGLLQLVHDYTVPEFKQNVLALADIGKHYGLPTILTTSFEQGPNGPLLPEIKDRFPSAPYFARPGQINAWDNADFVKAVKVFKRKAPSTLAFARSEAGYARYTACGTTLHQMCLRCWPAPLTVVI